MPPFIAEEKLKNNSSSKNTDNYEISLLVMAKKVGLSFGELNIFSLDEFLDYVDIWIGEEGTKEADQNDIDKFYSSM